ncbi:MAG: glutamate mutase L [Candidatus Cloacimonetes bacterium]|nr:glutamate mutase L [Candidatus Cloacimonadota bacterium]
MIDTKYLLITDIGSTNTKSILLQQEEDTYSLVGIEKEATTVESPYDDVKIGLYRVLRHLEKKNGFQLLTPESDEKNVTIAKEVSYLTTSSAGGGLQILVIGLSLNESASSAQRAAYGAGGVILDTLAIDDKRSIIERIQLIDLLRPDIILFSGGIDGGALASVIRMGEMLNVSNPKPKFGVSSKIPLIYAGNVEARDFIQTMFENKFDLHFVPNIRPNMKEENLEPARDEIHRLFMENVMEQAPGYSELKQIVTDAIIPTPSGVIKSLEVISNYFQKHVIAVDIGGATTDIFSNIFGRYYRTVSANYGMSYSITNVMAESGFANIRRWLPSSLDENYIRNYISNKMLYPTYIASDEIQEAIEHAAAREAIDMSQKHHLQMNFQIQRIGLLEMIKSGMTRKFKEAMYYEKTVDKRSFFLRDFDIVIGAGGVFTGTRNRKQVILMLADAFDIEGITEIWRDKDFISPHLGKLSEVDPKLAESLLFKYAYEKLALSIKPIFKAPKKKLKLLDIKMKESGKEENYEILSDSLILLEPTQEAEFEIHCLKGCSLGSHDNPLKLKSDVPLLIDTRKNNRFDFEMMNETLKLYDLKGNGEELKTSFDNLMHHKQIEEGTALLHRNLPYKGEIYAKEGDEVKADTLIGEAKFDPPRLFIINLITLLRIDKDTFKEGLKISEDDEISAGQKIFDIPPKGILSSNIFYHSNIRGVVERINYETGSIYLREIQDYPLKPMKINLAEKLGIKPKDLKGHLKKRENDFVRTGETLARYMFKKDRTDLARGQSTVFTSPTTGTITNIDYEKGIITIQYLKKPYTLHPGVKGKIIQTEENRSVTIEYNGITINGIIGFGRENFGYLKYLDDPDKNDLTAFEGKIIACPQAVDLLLLKKAQAAKIKGLVIPSINNADLTQFLGNEIGVALTGKEPIPYPIILTEGFGNFLMHSTIQDKLKKSDGKEIYLDTFTQIRAGVRRPKIIITD